MTSGSSAEENEFDRKKKSFKNPKEPKPDQELIQKLNKKETKAFTQEVLLFLAQRSQRRHVRESKTNRILKMYKVSLEGCDHHEELSFDRNKSPNPKPSTTTGQRHSKLPTISKSKGQQGRWGSSMVSAGSEFSGHSFSSDEDHLSTSSIRGRALSVAIHESSAELDLRRVSAPAVVITSVDKQSDEHPDDTIHERNFIGSLLSPQQSISEVEEDPAPPPVLSSSLLEQPSVSSSSEHKGALTSPKRTSSAVSSKLSEKDHGSVKSGKSNSSGGNSRKRSTRLSDALGADESQDPLQDKRFLDLVRELCAPSDTRTTASNYS